MRDIVLMGFTAFFSVAGLRDPFVGLLAYVGYSILAPHSQAWGVGRSFPHVQTIAIATIIGYLLSTRGIRMPRQRELLALVGLLGVFGLSTVFALAPSRAYADLIRMAKVILMVLLSTLIVDSERRLHALLRVIALSLGVYAVKGGLFFLRTAGTGLIVGPADSFLEANNSIGLALAMNVPLLVNLAKMEGRPWLRWTMRAMVALSYPAVIGTASRGAWLGLALITMVLLLKGYVSAAKATMAAVLLVIVGTISPISVPDNLTDRYESLERYEDDPSAQSRLWSWEFCTKVGLNRPILGGGFGLYSLESYARYMPEFLERWPGKVWSCHSMWLSVLAEHGIVGFSLWVWLLLACFGVARRIRARAHPKPGNGQAHLFGEMIETALIGFMLMGTFLDVAYFEVYYQLVGAVIVLKEIVVKRATAGPIQGSVTAGTPRGPRPVPA